MPPGSAEYWSWLFAARDARAALLGVYALMAEWRALMDALTELEVARVKLAWWHEEIQRLSDARPLHPITRHLSQLARGTPVDATLLMAALDAAAMQVAGAPLELAADLKAHAAALYGAPLEFAALLGTPIADPPALRTCVAELGAGRYLIRAIADYGREARTGRVAFAVDELLAAGIENADLLGAAPSARLQRYLDELRRRAAIHFADAAAALAPGDRAELRHLAVLAALGQRSAVEHRNPSRADFRLSDLYNAWNTARRAANR